jgi:cell wall-associated NlpC family hydrolase
MKDQTRSKIVAYAEWGIRNAPRIHYAQVRPIPVDQPRALPLITDCSGFVTLAYKDAGAPDPNGNHYNGRGYTGTLMTHGRKVTKPQPGDLIIFGEFPGHHVTIYMETWHGAWVTCSHGQEIGPLRVLNHREVLAQGLPYEIRSYLP